MKSTNQQKYESINPLRKMWLRPFQRRFQKAIVDLRPNDVLEVGAGEGFLLEKLHQALPAARLVGYELMPTAVAEAHRLFPALDVRAGNIYKINEPDHAWDVVIASEVFEHLDQPTAALREVKRLARRHVVLTVPWEPFFRLGNFIRGAHLRRFGNHPEHVNLWTAGEFARFVGTELKVEKVIRSMPWTIVVAKV